MKLLVQLLMIVYAAAVGVLGQFAAFDSADLGYSSVLAVASSLSALSLSIAVLIVSLGWRPVLLVRHWKPIFWLSCADLFLGLFMDGTIPTDFNAHTDPLWFVVALVVVAFLFPAYFFSYIVAYRSASRQRSDSQ